MTKRDVTGSPHLYGQGNSHQPRPHGVQRCGFRINGHLISGANVSDPATKLIHGGYGFISYVRWGGGGLIGLRHVGAHMRQDLVGQATESLFLQKRQNRVRINILNSQTVNIRQTRHILFQGHQFEADTGHIGKFNQILPPFRLLDLPRPGQQTVQITIFQN